MPFLIARATGKSIGELLAMPALEYRAWERHFGQGLAPEVWSPLLLVYLIEAVTAALGSPANLHKIIPWLREDTGRRSPARREAVAADRIRATGRRMAQEAMMARRLRDGV